MPVKCPYKCLITCDYKTAPYCIAQALGNAQQDRLGDGFVFADLAEEYALASLFENEISEASEQPLRAIA